MRTASHSVAEIADLSVILVTSSTWLNATKNGNLGSVITADACYGCSIREGGYLAHYWADEITTYVAATVVTIIHNGTNVTSTSTIPNPTTFDSGIAFDGIVWGDESAYVTSDKVVTQTL